MRIEKRVIGYVLLKGKLDTYDPPLEGKSSRWKHWISETDPRRCADCKSQHGRIYPAAATPNPEPPLHPNCRCRILPMEQIRAGFATKDGIRGADWGLKHYGKLPDYYISEADLEALGYRWGKPPRRYAPGKMMTKGEYRNDNGHLPSAPGRVWYEADINYYEGARNQHRIVWSNDGLIFVTYDHYHTFYEVI